MKKNILWIVLAMLSGDLLQASNSPVATPMAMLPGGPRQCQSQGGHFHAASQSCKSCGNRNMVYDVAKDQCVAKAPVAAAPAPAARKK